MNVITTTKTDAARSTTTGSKMWCVPAYTSGGTEAVNPPGCSGCSKAASHAIAEQVTHAVPYNRDRYDLIPTAEKLDVETLNRIGAALFVWHYTLFGYIGSNIAFNAGAANNATQTWRYEIVSCGQGTLELKGRNPKLLSASAGRLNPLWPFPDPETGSTARLIYEDQVGALPLLGAAVEFRPPSVLSGKLAPMISSITPPASDDEDDVTFTVSFADNVDLSNAKEPIDTGFPPDGGKYYCDLRVEFLSPQDWRDYQAPLEQQFTEQEVELTTATTHDLKDSDGNDCKVLPPVVGTETFKLTWVGLDGDEPDALSLLSTTESSGNYTTTLDLTGLTFTSVTVKYHARSVATDTTRHQSMAQCVHSKADPSGSYGDGGDQHCQQPTSTGYAAGDYHQNCWLMGSCNKFALVDESPNTAGDDAHLASLWTRADWVTVQGVAGSSATRNYSLVKYGGPSVAAIAGGFVDEVTEGFFPRRVQFEEPRLGQRVEYDDDDGTKQNVVTGAYYLQPYNLSTGERNVPDASGNNFDLGNVSDNVSGWTTGKDATVDGEPLRAGGTHVYNYTSSGTLSGDNTTVTSESYLVALDVTEVGDADLATRLREIY